MFCFESSDLIIVAFYFTYDHILRLLEVVNSHRILRLGIIILHCQLLHPVWVNFQGLLFTLHQKRWGTLATALPQSIHDISQIGDDMAWAFQHAGVLKHSSRKKINQMSLPLNSGKTKTFWITLPFEKCFWLAFKIENAFQQNHM